jgi:hypothetical protein
VIEFANGKLETAKKPVAKPEPAPAAPKAEKADKGPKPAKEPRTGESKIGLLPLPGPDANLVG